MSRVQQQPSRVFLEGPAGTGKTTLAIQHLQSLLQSGVSPDSVLILVPQRLLGRPYQLAAYRHARVPGDVTVVTLSGIARRNLERFWPLVAESAGFDPTREPVFLTLETAQYYMMRFVRPVIAEGVFDSISLTAPRIAAQLLDNMAKAAEAGFPFEQVTDRLCAAWGDRHSSRLLVYRKSEEISQAYRAYCRQHNLLDYAAQLEVFTQYLLPHRVFRRYFAASYQHLIADNIEEQSPVVHDFIRLWWDHWQSAWLIYDSDGGFRSFLGADPASAAGLRELCEEHRRLEEPVTMSPEVDSLERAVRIALGGDSAPVEISPRTALEFTYHTYYPQMLDWIVDRIADLVRDGISPREIAVLAPFLPDALRFSLQYRLESHGIPAVSHRPSRALRDEPAARALLTLLLLAHPDWGFSAPLPVDVADMLTQVIDGLDPVRAQLLTSIVYRHQHGGALSSFEVIQPAVRERITYQAGQHYETLRTWLQTVSEELAEQPQPLDYFLRRLFGEVLSQPGFGFHTNLDAGRIAAQLIESARKFRQVLYPYDHGKPNWASVGQEYVQLVNEGVLAALYMPDQREEKVEAVFVAPAYTFLMRNRVVDYQFWVDVGSESWWKRLEQPLTHPYVLMRGYPPGRFWSEEDEIDAQRRMLYRLMVGLLRRCRRRIYLGTADLNEQGYEQRGPMLYVFQQILQRYGEQEGRS